jgi:hypothetical protein
MRVKVKVDFNTSKILASRGLGGTNKVRKYLASEVVRLSDPYVPMQQGALKNQRQIASDGSQIVYTQPYAHYQYYGEVMAGRPPKSYTGREISYSGAPTRGARWTERMMIDKGHEIEKNVENYIKKG